MTKTYAGIGSRETPADVCALMTSIATHLRKDGYILRSGHAPGADSAFEAGAGNEAEIWIPWRGFNGSKSPLLPIPAAFAMAEEYHPKWTAVNLGGRSLHARNCHQVMGRDLVSPVEFVICWTYDGRASGGTGQALRIAEAHKIPVYNLFNDSDRRYWEVLMERPPEQAAQ